MDLPKRKKGPKLPPKPAGGGAAARRKQFEKERGLDHDVTQLPDDTDELEQAKDVAAPDDTKEHKP